MVRTITTIDERSSLVPHPKRWTNAGVRTSGSEGGGTTALRAKPAQNWTLKLSAALWLFAPSQKPKRFRRFFDAFESILSRHRKAYEQLAEGADR